MKKWKSVLLFVYIMVVLCSCNDNLEYPTNGLWYCEELNMEIDFYIFDDFNKYCIKQYKEDGSYDIYRCGIDYGNTLRVSSIDDPSTPYLQGSMKYSNVFSGPFQLVTSEGNKKTIYSFDYNGPSPYEENPRCMTTRVYFEEQLSEIANYSGTFKELLCEYSANMITKKNYGYRVSFKGESKAVNVMFDHEGNKLYDNICGISKNILHFEQASVKTLEDVKMIDPNGDYSLVWDGGDGSLKKSYHYTEGEEFFVEITYDSENRITDIYYERL